ncbi:MAG: porin [Thiogranum sp.]
MNKKLIVTAMGLVLAGAMGFANADVKLYGQVDLSINYDDPAAGAAGDDDINMRSNNSALGVKGSEDLGNGMAAFFKIEYQTDLANDNSGDGWTGRDQYVGMKFERFGKLTFGTTSTAYKTPGSKIDRAYRTSLQSRAVGLQSGLHAGKGENGQGRSTSVIRYDSPSWAGFSLMGTYNLDAAKEDPGGNDDDTYSVGAQYKGGNLYAAASYIDTQASDPSDTSAAQFLAKYTWNDLEFHGIYELDKGLITADRAGTLNTAGTVGGAEDDGADVWSVGASYTIGNNVILADYGQGSDNDGTDGIANTADDLDEYDVYRIAAMHMMSKRTFVYTGYANNNADDRDDVKRFSIGVRHHF